MSGWDWVGAPIPATILEAAERAYSAPPRTYHTFAHALEVLAMCGELANSVGFNHPREVAFAALFHDAVYLAGAADNEANSAALARGLLLRHGDTANLALVTHLIDLTSRHGDHPPNSLDHDEALFVDADMAILASPAGSFAAYDDGIRAEYALVPTPVYEAARAAFFEKLLTSPRIFHSDFVHEKLEQQARANLARALATLRTPKASG